MSPVRAVVFDMDGTLIDSTSCVVAAYQAVAKAAGVAVPSLDVVIEAYPLGPPRVILTHLLERPATAKDERVYLDALRAGCASVRVYDGIGSTLAQLAVGCRLAVFTGASAASARLLLSEVGLLSMFDTVVGGDEVARSKPHPDGILQALERLDVLPTSAAYVGDSPGDMRSAKAARTLAISAGWGHLFHASTPSDRVAASPGDLVKLILRGSADESGG